MAETFSESWHRIASQRVELRPTLRVHQQFFRGERWYVISAAVKTGIDNADALMNQTQSVLAPSNLGLLYLGMAIIKLLHEFGHGYMCRRFGGEVHTMGVKLLVLSPPTEKS